MSLDEDRAIARKIRTLLKAHPKGLIISDIAQRLGINRNSAAKYLEILLFTGQVEVRQIGMAKIYAASQRVPLSGLLRFAQDQIIVVDDEGVIVQINDRLLDFWELSREALIGERLDQVELGPFSGLQLPAMTGSAEAGRQEISFEHNASTVHCRVSLVPTVFDDGQNGCTVIIEDVTAEQEAERRLAESEQRYRAVVEDQTELITRFTPDGTITFANAAWRRFFGVDQDDNLVWIDLEGTVTKDELQEIRERERTLTPETPIIQFLQPVRVAGGEVRWVEGTQRGLFAADGTVIEYQAVVRDVTEAQWRQQELRIKEAAIAASIDGMAIFSPVGRIEYANRAFAATFGYDAPDGCVGRDYREFVYSDPATTFMMSELEAALLRDRHWFGELRCQRRDGRAITGQVSITLVYDEGRLLCILVSFVDVTERRQTEEALKLSIEKLQETIEFMPDATFIVNRERQVVAWNRTMETMTGFHRDEVLGTRDYRRAFARFEGAFPVLVDLIDLSFEELARTYPLVRRFGDTLYFETQVPTLHGGRGGYLWGKASPLSDRDGSIIGAIQTIRDISDWKRAEEAYRSASRHTDVGRRMERSDPSS
jgi:PAS domain S-box-containing protein